MFVYQYPLSFCRVINKAQYEINSPSITLLYYIYRCLVISALTSLLTPLATRPYKQNPAMPQPQQQQPRRILEKSRTVRRRYQRSNKRFEFSASQIQRIEREEEREKKAKQLREREKKKLANKKKKAEKEAKEREERRRMGIPEPNACKIPASQPLLLNFFGAGRKKVDGVRESMEEETEDSVATQESETSDEDGLIEDAEDERKRDSLSPVQEEEPNVMQQQEPQEPGKTDGKTDDNTKCISEDFSDLETELGDDWLEDPELEKHMASIGNTQQSLSSSAATHNNQPAELVQGTAKNWAALTESFEDDTSLMLQALDPTVLEEFETPQPKAILLEANETAASSPSVSVYAASNAASNAKTENTKYENHRANNLTPTNFKYAPPTAELHTSARQTLREMVPQNQHPAQKQQLRAVATSSNVNNRTIHNTPPAFKKPVIAASMQPKRLHFSPKKSVSQRAKIRPTQEIYQQPHFDAEDEFGDLPLSTQDVRDLDSMVGLG